MFVAEDSVYSCILSINLKHGKEKWPLIHLQRDAYAASGMGGH